MKKVLVWLDKYLEESLMVLFLLIIVCAMGLQVFMRYVMQNSLSWPDELTRYAFIWFVFLGIGYAVRNDLHLKVDILETSLIKLKPLLILLQDIIILIFCLYLFQPSIESIQQLRTSGQTSPALGIDIYLVYSALIIGFISAIFRLIQKYVVILIEKIKSYKQKESA